LRDPILKNPSQNKWLVGWLNSQVSQVLGPEFKLQHLKKKKERKYSTDDVFSRLAIQEPI
jgi:hypothetical protein